MFEFLFKYPASAFAKSQLVFLASWPVWILALLVIAGALALVGGIVLLAKSKN